MAADGINIFTRSMRRGTYWMIFFSLLLCLFCFVSSFSFLFTKMQGFLSRFDFLLSGWSFSIFTCTFLTPGRAEHGGMARASRMATGDWPSKSRPSRVGPAPRRLGKAPGINKRPAASKPRRTAGPPRLLATQAQHSMQCRDHRISRMVNALGPCDHGKLWDVKF